MSNVSPQNVTQALENAVKFVPADQPGQGSLFWLDLESAADPTAPAT